MVSKTTLAIIGLLSVSHVFADNKVKFLSTCFSDVCIGDDIDKVTQSQHKWVTAHLGDSDNTSKSVVHLREVKELRKKYSVTLSKSYRNLNAEDLEKLAGHFLEHGDPGEPTVYSRLMEPLVKDRVSFVAADSTVMTILKKVPACGFLPVHGVFVSESGLYTGVLMMPVNGKLTVVQLKRLFDLHVPDDASETQRSQITFDQVMAFVKQIDAKFGTKWDTSGSGSIEANSRAVGDGVVAYLSLEVPRGYHKRNMEPMMTLSETNFDSLSWPSVKQVVDGTLASSKACEMKIQAVAIE